MPFVPDTFSSPMTSNALPIKLTSRRLPGLDGIRGVAVCWVILYHFAADTGYRWLDALAIRGGFGVQIFLVLSGFIITTLLLAEESRGGVLLGKFYVRRAVRIIPVVTGLLAVLAIFQSLGLIALQSADYWASLAFVRNYVQGSGETAHLWSLSVEEQFYLVWPALFVSLPGRIPKAIACAAVFVIAEGYRSTIYGFSALPPASVGNQTQFHVAPLAAGALGAIATQGRALSASAINPAGLIAVALFPFVPNVFRFGCVAVIICAAAYGQGAITRTLEFTPLKALGKVSYSLYIWQQPWSIGPLSAWPAWAKAACVVGFTLASYFWIERPAHRFNSRFR